MAFDLEVTPDDTARALADGAAEVIDVREPYEREAGHVEGTRHVEIAHLAATAQSLDPERPLIFVCRVGARSLMAAHAFRRAGYEAYSMAGGLCAWVGEGRPLRPEGGRVADH